MGYMHIQNLYKDQTILLFKKTFALEKIHGTSSHVGWNKGRVTYFSGGESHGKFLALFDNDALIEKFKALGHDKVTVYGEAYGGVMQGMYETYGKKLHFIVFDVQIGDTWLDVPSMDKTATKLGFEVVPYRKVSTDIEVLDFERDRPSEVAERRGCGTDKLREGVVLRPLNEMIRSNGDRVIVKHKGAAFAERLHPPKIVDVELLKVLENSKEIADEWVTDMRLTHVLDKLPGVGIKDTKKVLDAMVEDVCREAVGEIVESKETRAAIMRKTAAMFKARS